MKAYLGGVWQDQGEPWPGNVSEAASYAESFWQGGAFQLGQ